jgi:lipid A 3-O-deacylase
MMNRLLGAALLMALICAPATARGVDDDDSAAFAGPGRVLRFDYANDYFTGTDRYYTQGLGLQYFDPALKRDPVMRLVPALPDAEAFSGLIVRNSGFTPSRLTSDAPLIGDRPFAATLTLSHVRVSRDRERALTLTAKLDAGVIGQAAGGKWQQVGIHKGTGNVVPRGWDNQIRNDLVLGYSLRLERTLASFSRGDFGVYGDAAAGTLYDNAALGISGRIGAVDARAPRRFYLFGRAENKLVAYDATLQGGLLNRGSPYVLTSPQIRRNVMRADVGVVLDMGHWALEASRTYVSREFIGGLSHEWVELSVIRRF